MTSSKDVREKKDKLNSDILSDIIEYDKISEQELSETEKNILKKHSIFELLNAQNLYELGKKKLKTFKIIQKRDKRQFFSYRMTSLRSCAQIGVSHYDYNGIRTFTTGIILYDKLLFYKIDGANHVKIIVHKVLDKYKDGTSSYSVICDEARPYTIKCENNYSDDQKLLLRYCIHAIRILIDDTLLKDLMNYTKNNSRLMILVFIFGGCGGLFIGGIGGLIISIFL